MLKAIKECTISNNSAQMSGDTYTVQGIYAIIDQKEFKTRSRRLNNNNIEGQYSNGMSMQSNSQRAEQIKQTLYLALALQHP